MRQIGPGKYAGMACVPPAPFAFDMPDGAIDARQLTNLQGTRTFGWQFVDVVFTDTARTLLPSDFVVTQAGGANPPQIVGVSMKDSTTATIELSAPIHAGTWTTIMHVGSWASTRLGFLPGDVSAHCKTRPGDILALIDALNGVVPRSLWSTDIDQSGNPTPADIFLLVDLLNGADAFDSWNGVDLP